MTEFYRLRTLDFLSSSQLPELLKVRRYPVCCIGIYDTINLALSLTWRKLEGYLLSCAQSYNCNCAMVLTKSYISPVNFIKFLKLRSVCIFILENKEIRNSSYTSADNVQDDMKGFEGKSFRQFSMSQGNMRFVSTN